MHETRFTNEIFAVLRENTEKGNLSGETVVNVRLSPFSHVTAETLQESFKELIMGERFKDARLKILPLEIPLECNDCKRSTRITEKVFGCPFCGSADINIRMEREFFVESIEIGHKEKGAKNGD